MGSTRRLIDMLTFSLRVAKNILMQDFRNRGVLAMAVAVLCNSFVWGGVSSPYGEIVVDGIPIGEEINMRELANIAYRARNTGDTPVRMLLSIVGQDPGEYIKPDYERIPELSWIRLGESEFVLGPGQEAVTDVFISVPNDRKHLGKKYQAYIWARAVQLEETQMLSVVAGIKSRILLNVSPLPLTREQRRQIRELKAGLGFLLMPDKLALSAVPLGKKIEVKNTFKKSFKLINPNDSDLRFKVSLVDRQNTVTRLPEGWEDPPAGTPLISIEPKEISVPASSIGELQLFVHFPNDRKFAEKKFMFVFEAALEDYEVPVSYSGRVFVETGSFK